MKNRIKQILKDQGRTLKEVADHLKIDKGSLSRAIAGNPTLETIQKIAEALGVEVWELFTDSIPTSTGDVHGVIWIGGKPNLINSFQDLDDLLQLSKLGQS